MADTQQGKRHESARAGIAPQESTYDDDLHAFFRANATIPAGSTYNEAFILWLQSVTGSSETNVNDLAALFASQQDDTYNWSSVGELGPGFQPPDIANLEWWFDASDTDTITDAGGGEVSDWADKSSNGRDLGQTNLSKRPNIDTINGNPSLYFDGGDVIFAEPTTSFSVSPSSAIVVCTPDDVTANRYPYATKNAGAGFGNYYQQRSANMQYTQIVSAGDNGIALLTGVLSALGTSGFVGRGQDTGPCEIYDAKDSASVSDALVGTLQTPMVNIYIGGHSTTPSSPFVGHIHEVALWSTNITDEERDNLITYINNKWSLT